MNSLTKDFYSGYEGEPEIQFIKVSEDGTEDIIRIWSGYFDDIMMQFKPSESGWSGLAYYYHLAIGWYIESPWIIPCLDETIKELENLNVSNCRFDKSKVVYDEIYNLLKSAKVNNENILIAEE